MVLLGCARQSSPTGGPVDTEPPLVLIYSPEIFSTNFSESGFEMEFDEFIQIKEFGQQLIISPPLNKTPEYRLKGKKLAISWLDTLLPNTTYQFNFGKAVVDLREGNPNQDLVYVFSTGDYIDSLSISGQLINVVDNTPIEGAAIMAYTSFSDSLPLTLPPNYFALSDANGYFRINYLPADTFKIFALAEENNNYLYNGPPEIIAFPDSLISSSLPDSVDVPKLILAGFIEEDTIQYIASQKGTDYGFYQTVFNIPAKDPTIVFYDEETNIELEAISLLNKGRDTLKTWVILPKRDGFEEAMVITRDDTLLVDTAFWYIEPDLKFKEKAALKIRSNTGGSKLDLDGSFEITFNNPIIKVDSSLFTLLEDSTVVKPLFVEQESLKRKLIVGYPYQKEKSYRFIAEAGAFMDLFEAYSDSINIKFSLQEKDFYGNLTVNIEVNDSLFDSGQRILQFLNSENGVISEHIFESTFTQTFKQLSPGKYKLKVIFDRNSNGEWDTGNYQLGIQPEKVSFYPDIIDVRSNWDMDIDWSPSSPFPRINEP